MLWTLIVVASVLLLVGGSKDGSGFGFHDEDLSDGRGDEEEGEETQFENSGDGFGPRVTVSVNRQKPPSPVDNKGPTEEEEEDPSTGGKNGGAGIVFEDKDDSSPEDTGESASVKENGLITHPGIMAAIVVGGVLVLVFLIVFFILIICCIRRKDEGKYDLDDAMKEKLRHITYTKDEEKEFFA